MDKSKVLIILIWTIIIYKLGVCEFGKNLYLDIFWDFINNDN